MNTAHEHDPRAVEVLRDELLSGCERTVTINQGRFRVDGVLDATNTARFILTREARLIAAVDELRRATINATHSLGSAALGTISVPSTLVARVNVDLTVAIAEWHRFLAAHRAATKPSEPTLEQRLERDLNSLQPGHAGTVRSIVETIVSLARERSRDGGK